MSSLNFINGHYFQRQVTPSPTPKNGIGGHFSGPPPSQAPKKVWHDPFLKLKLIFKGG